MGPAEVVCSHLCSRVCRKRSATTPAGGVAQSLAHCCKRSCCSNSDSRSAWMALNVSSNGCRTSSDKSIASRTSGGTSDMSNVSGRGGGVGALSTSRSFVWYSPTSPKIRWWRPLRRRCAGSCLHAPACLTTGAYPTLLSRPIEEQHTSLHVRGPCRRTLQPLTCAVFMLCDIDCRRRSRSQQMCKR